MTIQTLIGAPYCLMRITRAAIFRLPVCGLGTSWVTCRDLTFMSGGGILKYSGFLFVVSGLVGDVQRSHIYVWWRNFEVFRLPVCGLGTS